MRITRSEIALSAVMFEILYPLHDQIFVRKAWKSICKIFVTVRDRKILLCLFVIKKIECDGKIAFCFEFTTPRDVNCLSALDFANLSASKTSDRWLSGQAVSFRVYHP